MTTMMTSEELRNILKILLVEQLGTHNIAGQSVPAIVILANGDTLPNDRKVNGLEVVVVRSPVRYAPKAAYGAVNQRRTWQVFLSQYQGSYAIDDAVLRITRRFPGVTADQRAMDKSPNIRVQYSIRIPDVAEVEDTIEQ